MNFTRPLNSASELLLLSLCAPIALPIVWVGFTMHKELSYNCPALAKKAGVGIDLLKLTGAQAPTDERFFCVRFMVDCMGASPGARFPVSRKVNPVQSATPISLTSNGGSKITFTGDTYYV